LSGNSVITARYKVNSAYILLDFPKPLFQVGLLSGFFVNDAAVVAQPGPSTDSLWLDVLPFTSTLDDIWVEYRATPSPLLYLAGLPSERVVQSFKVLVTVEQISSEIQAVSNTALSPILGDFIDAYGLEEAIMISNPDNALAQSPDEYKFLRAFEDAEALWNTYLLAIDFANRAAITAGKRRTILIFARYFLDSRCRRKNVTADYENAIENLTKVNTTAIGTVIDPLLYSNAEEIIYGSSNCGTCEVCQC
jgi:phage gp36-like protein